MASCFHACKDARIKRKHGKTAFAPETPVLHSFVTGRWHHEAPHDTPFAMSEEPAVRKPSSSTWWLVAVLCALIAYLLSPGLYITAVVRWKWRPPTAIEESFTILTTPLMLACAWDPAGHFYTWYLSLCAGEPVRIRSH